MSKDQVKDKQNNNSSDTELQLGAKNQLLKLLLDNKKIIIASVSVILTISFGVYRYISGVQSFEEKQKTTTTVSVEKKDIEKEEDLTVPNIPSLPDFSKINNQTQSNVALPPPAIVEKKEELPQLPSLPSEEVKQVVQDKSGTSSINADRERQDRKMKSSIIQIGGVISNSKSNDDEISSVKVSIKKKGNLDYILNKGKIINATIENAVSSDFGGEIRAIISQDVYSEGNKNILIPKGARIFGIYSKGFKQPYGRIDIAWQRVDLPNGYVIEFSGNSVDNLGKIGAEGRVDMKHKEKIANSALTSVFNIAFARALDKFVLPNDDEAKSVNLGIAQSIKSSVITIYGQQNIDPKIKITQICSQAKSLIKDQTSTSYTSIDQACTQALVSSSSSTDMNSTLSSLVNAVTSAADQLVINSAKKETKEQKAAQDAFDNITKSVSDALDQKNIEPSVTIDQGSSIQIYVNEDYMFPKDAIRNVRILR
jgi:type IV secretion system protein VirB10